jgi:hypothetical protein
LEEGVKTLTREHEDEEWDRDLKSRLKKDAHDTWTLEHEKDLEGKIPKQDFYDLPENVQTNIIKRAKWRSRLFVALMTLATLAVVILVLFGYMLSNSFFITRTFGPNVQEAQRVTADVIQFTKPGISALNSRGKNNLFTWNVTITLSEHVGRGERAVGTFQDDIIFTKLTGKFNWNNGQHPTPFNFRYPGGGFPQGDGKGINPNGWKTLEKLPDGTVSQLAVSFNHLMTHDEFFNLIKKYDVKTVWLAIDTGIEKELSVRNQLLGTDMVFGYAPEAMNYGENGNAQSFTIQENGEGERRAQTYINEIQYLLTHKKWTDALLASVQIDPHLRGVTLENRLSYLQKNGVKLYGAVLTGPTKELLKLQGEEEVNAPFVGAVEWWNWDQQNANGMEFSY